MSRPKPFEDNADSPHAETFAAIKEGTGLDYVPVYFRTQIHAPQVVQGTLAVMDAFLSKGTIDPGLKQMIMVAISAARSCGYCESIHSAFCLMSGVTLDRLEEMANALHGFNPSRDREILKFAVKAALTPLEVTEEDHETLRAEGVTDAEIVEITSLAGMCVMFNIFADVMGLETDDGTKRFLEAQIA